MPELPEVETLKNALLPLIKNRTLTEARFFRKDLRFPIPVDALNQHVLGETIQNIQRRGKYLLLEVPRGAMLWHLGMSGRVIQYPDLEPVQKHTHAVFRFGPVCLHFIDPRRFGCIQWVPQDEGHPLLNTLGLEPLSDETTSKQLKDLAKGCKAPIKSFIMDAKRLVGIGNIYANEALFASQIRPTRPAGKLSLPDWDRLLAALQETLKKSIASGGTTLRDFYSTDGSSGYYSLDLLVYGKEGQPCRQCHQPIVRITQTGRSTFFCRQCQKR